MGRERSLTWSFGGAERAEWAKGQKTVSCQARPDGRVSGGSAPHSDFSERRATKGQVFFCRLDGCFERSSTSTCRNLSLPLAFLAARALHAVSNSSMEAAASFVIVKTLSHTFQDLMQRPRKIRKLQDRRQVTVDQVKHRGPGRPCARSNRSRSTLVTQTTLVDISWI